MSAAFETSASTHFPSGGTSLTQVITVPAVGNPLLIVHVPARSQSVNIQYPTGVSSNVGGALTRKAEKRNSLGSGEAYASTWILVTPAPGPHTITATFNVSVDARACHIIAEVWSGADQTDPCPAADVVQKDTAESPSTATPTNLVAGDATSGVVASNPNGATSITPNTAYVGGVASTGVQAAEGWAIDTTGITTSGDATWQTNHAITAVRIKASGGAAPSPLVEDGVIFRSTQVTRRVV